MLRITNQGVRVAGRRPFGLAQVFFVDPSLREQQRGRTLVTAKRGNIALISIDHVARRVRSREEALRIVGDEIAEVR
jgi:hypothetical protein